MKLKYLGGRMHIPRRRLYPLISPENFDTIEFNPLYQKWIPTRFSRSLTNMFVDCASIRKFRRLLRKWSIYLPPGTEFTLHRGRNKIIGKTT